MTNKLFDGVTFLEVGEQSVAEGLGSIEQVVIDIAFSEFRAVAAGEGIERRTVSGFDLLRTRHHRFASFDVHNFRIAIELERAFFRINDMKDDHFVPPVPEMFEGGNDLLRLVQEITHHDNQSSLLNPLGDLRERLG